MEQEHQRANAATRAPSGHEYVYRRAVDPAGAGDRAVPVRHGPDPTAESGWTP